MNAARRTTATTWQVASLLLDYPDGTWWDRIGVISAEVTDLPDRYATPLRAFLAHAAASDPTALAAEYVSTFDTRRRCCLYLTYYVHGDTRNRGMALLNFKSAYRRAGLVLGDEELPDHLGVLLEFGATADHDDARRLLLEHRAGLELLRLALTDADSPWAHVVRAVCLTLPSLRGDDRDVVRRLAAQGPPGEAVGLQPFAMQPTRAVPSQATHPSAPEPTGARR